MKTTKGRKGKMKTKKQKNINLKIKENNSIIMPFVVITIIILVFLSALIVKVKYDISEKKDMGDLILAVRKLDEQSIHEIFKRGRISVYDYENAINEIDIKKLKNDIDCNIY